MHDTRKQKHYRQQRFRQLQKINEDIYKLILRKQKKIKNKIKKATNNNLDQNFKNAYI